jgi:hypothetical protein
VNRFLEKIDPTFPMVPVLSEISTYMEPHRTVQDEQAAFEQIKEVVTSKKTLESYPILEEMTQGWTLADYHAVGKHALSAYGFDTEPTRNNPLRYNALSLLANDIPTNQRIYS